MGTLFLFLTLVAVPILAVGIGWRLQHVTAASLAGTGLLGLLWLLNFYAISTDWRDADGFIDCWPDCSFVQEAAAMIFWNTPIFIGVLLLVALVATLVPRFRR